MRTLREIESDIAKLEAEKALTMKLNEAGIKGKNLTNFRFVPIYSNYSMGENVYWYVNGKMVECIDQTEVYGRSCKYNAKHGKIVLSFTKKDFKEYAEKVDKVKYYDYMRFHVKEEAVTKYTNLWEEERTALEDFIRKHIEESKSEIKIHTKAVINV